MKLWCALLVLGGAVAAPGHRFACTDYTQGKVFLVDGNGKVEWTYDAPNANDRHAVVSRSEYRRP